MAVYIKGLSIKQVKALLDIAGGDGLGEAFDTYLVEVPEPHGDLVDANKLLRWLLDEWKLDIDYDGMINEVCEDAIDAIQNAPIVIEGEGYPAFLSKTLGEFVEAESE